MIINSYCDNNVDIYYYDLKEWIKEDNNIDYFERAIMECYVDVKNYDFYKHIQCAQFMQLEEAIYNQLDDDNTKLYLLLWTLGSCGLVERIGEKTEEYWQNVLKIALCEFDGLDIADFEQICNIYNCLEDALIDNNIY